MNNLPSVFCWRVQGSLTYGEHYQVLETDERRVRVNGDDGRAGWFPVACFGPEPPPRLLEWQPDDPIPWEWPAPTCDVIVNLSDGSRRWCTLATPASVQEALQREPAWHQTNLILLERVDPDGIEAALRYLDGEGRLREATRPLLEDQHPGPDEPSEH